MSGERLTLSDTTALVELASGIASFRHAVAAHAESSIADAKARLSGIERRGLELDQARQQAYHELMSVGDDDDDYYERERVAEAESDYAEFLHIQSEAHAEFGALASKVDSFVANTARACHAASEVYRKTDRDVQSYLAIRNEGPKEGATERPIAPSGTNKPPFGGSTRGVIEAKSTLQQRAAKADRANLPDGFVWIDIDDVSDDCFISDEADFKKVDKRRMERGITVLERDLLPLIAANPDLTQADLCILDRERGTDYDEKGYVHPDSLEVAWSAFLKPDSSAEIVRINAVQPDGSLGVLDGRHRLSVAKSLGIKRLPGKFQTGA